MWHSTCSPSRCLLHMTAGFAIHIRIYIASKLTRLKNTIYQHWYLMEILPENWLLGKFRYWPNPILQSIPTSYHGIPRRINHYAINCGALIYCPCHSVPSWQNTYQTYILKGVMTAPPPSCQQDNFESWHSKILYSPISLLSISMAMEKGMGLRSPELGILG